MHAAQLRAGQPLTYAPTRGPRLTRDANGNKRCSKCREWLPEGHFHNWNKSSDGLRSACIVCERLARHSLDRSRYEALLARQDGGCVGCGAEQDNPLVLEIDHDHGCCPGQNSCGQCVRGLLCKSCNMALGLLKDDAATLARLAKYLG